MIKFLPFIFVILWSSAFITTKPIVHNSAPFTGLCLRFFFVALGFFIFSIFTKKIIIDKKKHIIQKLQIEKNMNVLDIGCGWGGLSLQIAKDTGAKVKGITLSQNQLATAQKRAYTEGLNEKVTFALQDYRDEKNIYDRIVSVGTVSYTHQTLPTKRIV